MTVMVMFCIVLFRHVFGVPFVILGVQYLLILFLFVQGRERNNSKLVLKFLNVVNKKLRKLQKIIIGRKYLASSNKSKIMPNVVTVITIKGVSKRTFLEMAKNIVNDMKS